MYSQNEFGHEIFDRVKQILYTFNVPFADEELNDAIRKTIAQNPSDLAEADVNRATYHIVMYAFKRAGREPDREVIKQTIRTLSERKNPASSDAYRAALDRAQMGEIASELERRDIEARYHSEIQKSRGVGCRGCIFRLLTIPGCLAMSIIYGILTSSIGLLLLFAVVLPSIGQSVPVDLSFLSQFGIDTSNLGQNIGGGSALFSAGMAGASTLLGAILFAARMLRSIIGLIFLGLFALGTGFIILFVMQTGIVDTVLMQLQNALQAVPTGMF